MTKEKSDYHIIEWKKKKISCFPIWVCTKSSMYKEFRFGNSLNDQFYEID